MHNTYISYILIFVQGYRACMLWQSINENVLHIHHYSYYGLYMAQMTTDELRELTCTPKINSRLPKVSRWNLVLLMLYDRMICVFNLVCIIYGSWIHNYIWLSQPVDYLYGLRFKQRLLAWSECRPIIYISRNI